MQGATSKFDSSKHRQKYSETPICCSTKVFPHNSPTINTGTQTCCPRIRARVRYLSAGASSWVPHTTVLAPTLSTSFFKPAFTSRHEEKTSHTTYTARKMNKPSDIPAPEHERVQFWLRLSTRGLPYTHAARPIRHLEKPRNASARLTDAMT